MSKTVISILYAPTRSDIGVDQTQTTSDHLTIVLLGDNWDDFGHKTLFSVYLYYKGQKTELGYLRVLVDGVSDTRDAIVTSNDRLKPFNFGKRKYLSLGSYSYYTALIEAVPEKEVRDALLQEVHDVVYLEYKASTELDLGLRDESGFANSLLRDSDYVRAYHHARRELLFRSDYNSDRFNFAFQFWAEGFTFPHQIKFRFEPETAVPTSIAILIGRNGTGKTQTLYRLVDCLLGEDKEGTIVEPQMPPFRKKIAVSFSPFERFPTKPSDVPKDVTGVEDISTDDSDEDFRVTSAADYTYCGFRSIGRVHKLRNARQYTINNLVSILKLDHENRAKSGPSERARFVTLRSALRNILTDDVPSPELMLPFSPGATIPDELSYFSEELEGTSYLDLRRAFDQDELINDSLKEGILTGQIALKINRKEGVMVVSHFSAGQEMFLFVVVATLAQIEDESILLIDEPELYLHPNIELAYIRMLRDILDTFASYAVIATHSVLLAREVPSRNVHIFRLSEPDRIPLIVSPTIETFGADLTEIANLVFDNVMITKPYEEWLDTLISKGNANSVTFKQLRDQYGKSLNSESLTYLRNALLTQQEKEQPEQKEDNALQGTDD